MSLRLDPKYHGVRVARVRPKFKALSAAVMHKGNRGYERIRFMWLNETDALFFTRARIPYTNSMSWVPPERRAARIDGIYYAHQKDALEALGLR